MALQHIAVFFELVLVVRDELLRRIVRQVFDGHNLEPEQTAGDIDVGAVVMVVVASSLPARAGVDREADVADVCSLLT